MVGGNLEKWQTDRKGLLCEVQRKLAALLYDVCPACARQETLYCEVVNGVHVHVSGVCRASSIRQLINHVDDVRHQFANEFNEDEKLIVSWHIKTRSNEGFPKEFTDEEIAK